MSWFRSPKDGCWFPDYVVQKDASYGPISGKGSGAGGTSSWGPAAWFGNGNSKGGGTGGVSSPMSLYNLRRCSAYSAEDFAN